MSKTVSTLGFENVGVSQTATLKLHGSQVFGNVLNRLIVNMGGTFDMSDITAIRMRANGKLILDTTGPNLVKRQAHKGITASAAYIALDFNEIRSKTIIGQKLGAIDTRLLETLTCEVDIDGTPTSPTLGAKAMIDSPAAYDALYGPAERSLMAKVLAQTYSFSAAGEFAVPIPFGKQGGSLIRRLHFFGSTVTAVRIKKDGKDYFDRNAGYNSFILGEFARADQADTVTADFIEDGNQSDVLNAAEAQTMEYYITVSGSGNVRCEMELLDPLANN